MSELNSINNSYLSYQKIINFYNHHRENNTKDIAVSLRYFFAADMSATLGAILDLFSSQCKEFHFDNTDEKIKEVLCRNGFLSHYGGDRYFDTKNTTIEFKRLRPVDAKVFGAYVTEQLINRTELPWMSKLLKDKIAEGVCEIFSNAEIHSETEYIYACGQFFPNLNSIRFTLVDTGIGFKERVRRSFGTKITAVRAIEWALVDRHTTKDETGGLGLAILKEFIEKNGGKMQIVSNEGFYEFSNGETIFRTFNGDFPGTLVSLEFKTNDDNNYALAEESSINDIF